MSATKGTVPVEELIHSAPVPMLVVDREYEIQTANTEWVTSVGADSVDAICGSNALDFIPENERDQSRERLDTVLQEQTAVTYREFELQTVTGERRYARGSITPASLPDVDIAAHIVMEDITDSKESKQEIQRHSRQIDALHDVAVQLSRCDRKTDVYDLMVEAAEDILEFDMCLVGSVQEGIASIEAKSESTPEEHIMSPRNVEEAGHAGKAYRQDQTILFEGEDPSANPQDDYKSGVSVPISGFGFFQTVSYEEDAFTQTDIELAELLTSHGREAVQRIEHEAEIYDRQRELETQREKIERLHEVGVEMAECDTATRIYELMIEAGEDILNLEHCIVDSVQDGHFHVEAVSASLSDDEIFEVPVDAETAGIAGKAYRTGESILEEEEEHPEAHPESDFRSSFTVPIAEYGVFQALSRDVVAFDSSDIELVELLAEHAQAALQRLEHERELHHKRQQVTRLHEVGTELASCESPEQVYELIVETGENILDLNMCLVAYVENGRLRLGASTEDVPEDGYIEPEVDSIEAGLSGKSYRENRSYLIDNVAQHPEANPQDEYSSCIMAPIPGYGNVQAVAYDEGAFEQTDLELIRLLTEHARAVLQQIEHEKELEDQRQELDLLRKVFSRVFRHNVRNELTVIKGNAEMITTTASNRSIGNAGEIIMESTDRLINHTEKAQEVEEVVQERHETQTGSLQRIVSKAVTDFKTAYPDSQIIDNVDDVEIAAVIGIEKAFSNAVENALEHNESPVEVTISSEERENDVLVVIQDDGSGIPQSEQQVLDNETESALSHGSGVGLWLMKWLVDKSDGRIETTNTETGARIEIRLPKV